MRINKFVAKQLGITRREADELIRNKSVKLNGDVALLGDSVQMNDTVEVQSGSKKYSYDGGFPQLVAVYKPPNCFIETESIYDSKKVSIYQFLTPFLREYTPVGAMNYMSEGILIMKNNQLDSMPPKGDSKSKMVYLVSFDTSKSPLDLEKAVSGSVQHLAQKELGQYDFLDLDSTQTWYVIHKNYSRSSLYSLLNSSNIIPKRIIKISDFGLRLTEQLHDQFKSQGYSPVSLNV